MAFGVPINTDGIVNLWGDFKDAWHDSALPGQPGYIAPAMEQINDAGVTVGDGTTQFTAPAPSNVFDEEQNYAVQHVPPNPTFNPSGLSYLNTMYPPVYDPQMSSGLEGLNAQPFTPQPHNPTIQSSQATDDISWAGGEGWSEEEFGGPGWTYGGGGSDTDGSLSYTFNGGGAGTYSAAAQSPEFILSQDLSQRTPSGTQYAPDLSAYNDSSLFNYAGPGGLSEYTYGQGLPTQGADYGIWGTPSDMVNPYYEGQFATPQPQGPADGAINMPAVELPEGVPSTNQVINNSLNSGIPTGLVNRPPSTVFSSPGDTPSLTDRMLEDSPLTGLLMDEQLQNQINRDRVISDIVSSTDNSYVNPNEETLQAGIVPPYVNPNEETMQAGIVDEYTKGVLSGEIPAIDQVIAEYEAENAPVDRSLEIYAAAEKALANQTEEEKRWGFDLPRLKLDNRVDEFPMSGWGLIPPDEALVDKGEIGNLQMDSGLTWNNGVGYDGPLDNYIVNNKVGGFNQNQPTDIAARRNYLFNDDLDLGRPGDDSYVEFKPTYVPPAVSSGPPTRQAIPRITEPSIWDRVSDSFNRNFNLFGR
jgi:hypothetical protein